VVGISGVKQADTCVVDKHKHIKVKLSHYKSGKALRSPEL
jgi:hypothetical protein